MKTFLKNQAKLTWGQIAAAVILTSPFMGWLWLNIHAAAYPHRGLIVFEDGSFILGILTGCLPWGICG